MSYEVACPHCRERLQIDERSANEQIRCPACQGQFVPASEGAAPAAGGNGLAIAALTLGIIGMVGWCLPICGFPINLAGLICGGLGQKCPSRGMALTGMILSGIGMVLTLINAAAGVYLQMQKGGLGGIK
jgi:hypothetical protein